MTNSIKITHLKLEQLKFAKFLANLMEINSILELDLIDALSKLLKNKLYIMNLHLASYIRTTMASNA